LATSEDSGAPVLRKQRADQDESGDRSNEIQNMLLNKLAVCGPEASLQV
jgi:hypothetical protein